MKVGLYFGSFNPIHVGHLIIANHMQQYSNLDEVWLVLSPHNPFKEKQSLANDYERLHMARLAVEDFAKLRVSDVEFKLPQPNYTVNTLVQLKEDFPKYEFSLLMGEDNLSHLHKWKNSDFLVSNHDIYVYPRLHKGKKTPQVSIDRVKIVDAPIIEISSTQIRKMIQEKKIYQPLLPPKVFDYIDGSSLYK